MRKVIIALMVMACVWSCAYAVSTNAKYDDIDAMTEKQYSEIQTLYEDVHSVFPNVELMPIPSLEEFKDRVRNDAHDNRGIAISESYSVSRNGSDYTLNIFDDGGFEMISVNNRSIFIGESDLVNGTPLRMRWRYYHVDGYHQVSVSLYVLYDYLSEQYYFQTPAVFGDVYYSLLVAPVALYRTGGTDRNIMTYEGLPYDYDDLGMGVEYYHDKLYLIGTVNVDTGYVTVSHYND